MKKTLVSLLAFSFAFLASPAGVFAQTAQTATLSLDPSTGTFNQGCSYNINVNLDTGGAQTDGVDVIIFYDTSRLIANSPITNGTIYANYPGSNIDSTAGKITISALASISAPFAGKGTVATVNFTVLSNAPTGVTQIKFDFDPNTVGNTRDSNVALRGGGGVDILSSVVNGNYTIGTGSCGAAATTPPTVTTPVTVLPGTGARSQGAVSGASPSSQQIPYKSLPQAGSEQFTFTLAIVGSVLTVLGILGLALL